MTWQHRHNDIRKRSAFFFMSLCSCCSVAKLCLHVHNGNITSLLRRDKVLFMSFVTLLLCLYIAFVNQASKNGQCQNLGHERQLTSHLFLFNEHAWVAWRVINATAAASDIMHCQFFLGKSPNEMSHDLVDEVPFTPTGAWGLPCSFPSGPLWNLCSPFLLILWHP